MPHPNPRPGHRKDGSLVGGRVLALGRTMEHAAVLNSRHDLVLAA